MIELVLKIPSTQVLEKLVPILRRLKIVYQTKTITPLEKETSRQEAIIALLQSGALEIPNFEQFMEAFEESRQDRPLIGREE